MTRNIVIFINLILYNFLSVNKDDNVAIPTNKIKLLSVNKINIVLVERS
jgi:hypothetical protein